MNSLNHYGISVEVTNPTTWTTLLNDGWRIWTRDSAGYGLDGADSTLLLNPNQASGETSFFHKSFGLYDADMPDLRLTFYSMQPFELTKTYTSLTVYPIRVLTDVVTSLRITAPNGFEWDNNPATFQDTTHNTTKRFPAVPVVAGVLRGARLRRGGHPRPRGRRDHPGTEDP